MDLNRPQILLFGNGLLQSFGGESWNNFLISIKKRDDLPHPDKIKCPEPLKAILLTNDQIDKAMKEKCQKLLSKNNMTADLSGVIGELFSIGFDHILTTNYTYELEQAAIYPKILTESKVKRITKSTVGNVEKKYLIHTYNEVVCGGIANKIWHIHGEARKPDSTILGHYYYGNSLYKIKDEAGKRSDYEHGMEARSWVEAFLFADIYCLGFGFGLAEFDLWWLLNRKAREKNNSGKLYFYEPIDESQREKIELLNLMKSTTGDKVVKIENLGYTKGDDIQWSEFYQDAINDIRSKMCNDLLIDNTEKELLLV